MAGETAQQKQVMAAAIQAHAAAVEKLATAIERMGPPRDAFGTPLLRITGGASELVPTVQFGNATIGPVLVERFVADGDDESVQAEIHRLTSMVEKAVADDRQTLHEQIRARAGQ